MRCEVEQHSNSWGTLAAWVLFGHENCIWILSFQEQQTEGFDACHPVQKAIDLARAH